jgi:hypothetical protein
MAACLRISPEPHETDSPLINLFLQSSAFLLYLFHGCSHSDALSLLSGSGPQKPESQQSLTSVVHSYNFSNPYSSLATPPQGLGGAGRPQRAIRCRFRGRRGLRGQLFRAL